MKRLYIALGCLTLCSLPFKGLAQNSTLLEYLNDTNRISKRDSIRIAKAKKAKKGKTTDEPQDTVIDKYNRFINILSPQGESFGESIEVSAFEKVLSEKAETFLLRNKTPFTISDLTIRIVYKTPNDSLMISYRDIVLKDEILPHSTKRCSIESFDTYKRYFYIDNPLKKDERGLPFLIHMELQGYKIAITPSNYDSIIDEAQ